MNRHVQRVAARHRVDWLARLLTACFLSLCFGVLAGRAARAQDTGVVVQSCGTLPAQYQLGGPRPIAVDINGNLCTTGNSTGAAVGNAGFVSNATPVQASTTGTIAATTATLPASATQFTYICGFSINSTATAAAAGNATITGVKSGTLNYEMGTGTAPAVVVTTQSYAPCLPSSAINTSIAVVSAAPGTGGVISVTAWGFQQ